jgi:hypothetical protein
MLPYELVAHLGVYTTPVKVREEREKKHLGGWLFA